MKHRAPACASPGGGPASPPLLSMRGIQKHFDGVHALKGVDLDVRSGEVHALVGENGAGKTTLMHILAGVEQPDEGTIVLNGSTPVLIRNEHTAQRLGIAIVFQERSLFAPLTVAENIFSGRQPVARLGRIDTRVLLEDTRLLLAEVGLAVAPQAVLSELSSAQQQMVEIAKALSLHAKLIIFDEPTAALTDTETRALFRLIARLKTRGVGVIYISHRLEEVFQIADRVTVLKDGEGQGTVAVSETTAGDLIRRMVGRDVERPPRGPAPPTDAALLEVRSLSDPINRRESGALLRDITFSVRAGEIVGLAGLAGAGRTELALSIFGARPGASGEIRVGGKRVSMATPAEGIAAGIGYVTEDRKECGLFLDMSIARNVTVAKLRDFGGWWFNHRREREAADDFRARLRIASHGPDQITSSLSGGNQQKVLLARWLLVHPRILIVDEPTRGVDVGAKAEVHALLLEFARRGAAVLMISSDLPEVLAVSDRVLVLRQGRMSGELSRAEATEERVMHFATMSGAGEGLAD